MCNLYSETKGQDAIRALFRTAHDRTGNLPAFPGIFPDQLAPIVRNSAAGARELVMARWGMPGPQRFESALARLAFCEEPLSRARDQLLRVRRHEASQDTHVVRTQRRPAAIRLRGPLDEVAGRARTEERAGRGRA
jgi:putative SOS response-associated peptidase YedK